MPVITPNVSALPSTPAVAGPGSALAAATDPGAFARELTQAGAQGSSDKQPATTTPETPNGNAPEASKASADQAADSGAATTPVDKSRETDQKPDAAATDDDAPAWLAGLMAQATVATEIPATPVAVPAVATAADETQTEPPVDAGAWLAGLLGQAPATAATPKSAVAVAVAVLPGVPGRAAKTSAAGLDRTPNDAAALVGPTSSGRGPAPETALRGENFVAALAAQPGLAPTVAAGDASAQAAPVLAAVQTSQSGATSASPTGGLATEARIDAPLDSPDFAAALGTQLSVLVKDGVQHARLHLNPASMGPISVQIALDGSAARIHMTAEQAQTRQALEQAMPMLASALRESGLTLTGGGVFEQPRDPRQDADNASTGAGARAAESGVEMDPALLSQARPRALRGALDVFA